MPAFLFMLTCLENWILCLILFLKERRMKYVLVYFTFVLLEEPKKMLRSEPKLKFFDL